MNLLLNSTTILEDKIRAHEHQVDLLWEQRLKLFAMKGFKQISAVNKLVRNEQVIAMHEREIELLQVQLQALSKNKNRKRIAINKFFGTNF